MSTPRPPASSDVRAYVILTVGEKAVRNVDEIVKREMRGRKVNCERGCTWCCHQLVIVTNWDDGRVILRALRAQLQDEEFAEFEAALREQARNIAALSHEEAEGKRWTCPLLENGECRVYEVRPVACRSVFSSDKRCCQAMMEAEHFEDLSGSHRTLASEIGERSMRIQIEANDTRPIHGAIELRALLVRLLDGGE